MPSIETIKEIYDATLRRMQTDRRTGEVNAYQNGKDMGHKQGENDEAMIWKIAQDQLNELVRPLREHVQSNPFATQIRDFADGIQSQGLMHLVRLSKTDPSAEFEKAFGHIEGDSSVKMVIKALSADRPIPLKSSAGAVRLIPTAIENVFVREASRIRMPKFAEIVIATPAAVEARRLHPTR